MLIPVHRILFTVEGEAYKYMGATAVVLRLGAPDNLSYVYLAPHRRYPESLQLFSADEIAEVCEGAMAKVVHIGGDDPFLGIDPLPLIRRLAASFTVLVDTFGLVPPSGDACFDLAVSPRPGLPVHPLVWARANEVRLYRSQKDKQWNMLCEECLDFLAKRPSDVLEQVSIVPREITDDTLADVFNFVRQREDTLGGRVRVSIPLYRVFDMDHDAVVLL